MFTFEEDERPAEQNWHNALEEYIAGGFMVALFIVLNTQIFTRYVLGAPLSWTEEVARYLFVWMVFVGSAGALLSRSHVAIEMFVEALDQRKRLAVHLLCDILSLSFLVMLAYWSTRTLGRVWAVSTSALELPSGILYSAVPLSALLMIIRLLQRLARDIREDMHKVKQ